MNSILLSRKASERLAGVLVSLIISLMAGMMFIYLGFFYNPSGAYLANYYANDVAATVHAIQTVPGDISITYPLQDGMHISTDGHQVVAKDLSTSAVAEAFFMEMAGTTITDMTAEHKLFLSKNQGKISITNEPIDLASTCPSSLHLKGLEKSLDVRLGTSTNKFFTITDLQTMQQAFKIEAERQGFTSPATKATFTLTLSSKDIGPTDLSTIVLRTPNDIGKVADYENILCNIFKGIELPLMLQVEKTSTTSTNYALNIEIRLQEKDKEKFTKVEQVALAQKIVQALSEAVQ